LTTGYTIAYGMRHPSPLSDYPRDSISTVKVPFLTLKTASEAEFSLVIPTVLTAMLTNCSELHALVNARTYQTILDGAKTYDTLSLTL